MFDGEAAVFDGDALERIAHHSAAVAAEHRFRAALRELQRAVGIADQQKKGTRLLRIFRFEHEYVVLASVAIQIAALDCRSAENGVGPRSSQKSKALTLGRRALAPVAPALRARS